MWKSLWKVVLSGALMVGCVSEPVLRVEMRARRLVSLSGLSEAGATLNRSENWDAIALVFLEFRERTSQLSGRQNQEIGEEVTSWPVRPCAVDVLCAWEVAARQGALTRARQSKEHP